MTSRFRTFHVAVLTLALAISLTVTAIFPTHARAEEPADVWQLVTATLFDIEAGKQPTLVIRAVARNGLQPPVEGAVAIPKGAELIWAGNILGGDPGDDPMVAVEIDTDADAYDLVKFTFEASPVVQIELAIPEGTLTSAGGAVSFDLTYTSAGSIDIVRLGAVVPTTLHVTDAEPAVTAESVPGVGVLYSAETSPVAAGDTLTLVGNIVAGADPELPAEDVPSTPSTATPSDPATAEPIPAPTEPGGPRDYTWIIIGALVALIAVVIWFIYRQIRTGSGERTGDLDDNESAEDLLGEE